MFEGTRYFKNRCENVLRREDNVIFLEFFETFKFAAILAHHSFKPYSHQSLNMIKGGLVKHGCLVQITKHAEFHLNPV